MKKITSSLVLGLLISMFIITGKSNAQSWDDGMYHMGRNMMDWRGTESLYTVSGKIIIDSSFSTTDYMNNMRPAFYYLDTVGDGSRNYQLFFGPYWYQPDNGTTRPVEGQTVTLTGIKITTMSPPMLSVYIIDNKLWRDTVGVEPWSGGWIHKTDNDSSEVYCPTDSMAFMKLAPNSMGSGMMGPSMMWPDSIFCQFEEMLPDSMPGNQDNHSLAGYHLDMFDPDGQTMMQMGSMNNGTMTMQKSIGIRFHIPQDSLDNMGISMSDLVCQYMDENGNWNNVNRQIDVQNNTVSISQSNLYSFYRVVSSSSTGVQNDKLSVPGNYNLEQNYPNPFNPTTVIKYSIPNESKVILKVYNLLGKEVTTLVNTTQSAGTYNINFDASNLPSGIYFYSLTANNFRRTKKLVLLK